MTMNFRQIFFLLLISLAGCASKTPFELSKEGPTMKENFENHLLGNTELGVERVTFNRALDNDINYRQVEEQAYRRIPNPELEMFIYPHRATRHGVIVPGYSVRFPMYEKVQYGLVGDVLHAQ